MMYSLVVIPIVGLTYSVQIRDRFRLIVYSIKCEEKELIETITKLLERTNNLRDLLSVME